jgi:7-cyano-7-deazaguanine synthase in queuosine biosynthesis
MLLKRSGLNCDDGEMRVSSPNLVLCGGLPLPKRAPAARLELDTSPDAPAHKRVFLQLDPLTKRLVDNLDPVMADAVEIASYVFTADKLVERGSNQMRGMGADWRRNLRFMIPVRNREIWCQQEVYDALVDALSFLSEDEFTFEFKEAKPGTRIDPFFGFDEPDARTIHPDDIILFSGGLDSVSGAVQQLIGQEKSAVLVTHKSSKNLANLQDAVVRSLIDRTSKDQIFYAPVWVSKGDYETVEYTQRTRSFLFVSLGMAIAQAFGRDTVQFFENGITSFNLPIAEHVIGTRASRTTHPRTLATFARLFSLLLQRRVNIENQFLWRTKSEVVEVLRANGCEALIAETTSCASVRNWAMTTKQCGVCSQCIERRFAVLAAGLGAQEPVDSYGVEPFTGPHTKPEDITMAEQHISRAERLASMSEHGFLATYGQVFRALPYLEGAASENASMIFRLHQRYGRTILDVVNNELRSNAGFAEALRLPSTSLLAMINAPLGAAPVSQDPIENERTASDQAAADKATIAERRFIFALDDKTRRVVFADGPVVEGRNFDLIARLTAQFRADLAAEKSPIDFAYVPTGTLLLDLKIQEHSLGQRVLRTRKELERQFIDAIDYMLDDQDIIQSDRWYGYRLNPYLVLVDLSQLHEKPKCHDSRCEMS